MTFFLKIISSLPISLLYILSDIIYIILYYIISIFKLYRNDIVSKNLESSFPEKNLKWINHIKRKFYSNFIDTLLEIVKLKNLDEKDIINRVKINNPELISKEIKANKSIIILSSHYNNWEWLFSRISILVKKNLYAPYKPLSNKKIDKILISIRQRFGGKVIQMSRFYRFILNNKNKNFTYFLLNDQVPLSIKNNIKYDFLGKKTSFNKGIERLEKEKIPTFYAELNKIKRGYYIINFYKISKNDVTFDYVKKLEKTIKNNPENWLWSHNRWKR